MIPRRRRPWITSSMPEMSKSSMAGFRDDGLVQARARPPSMIISPGALSQTRIPSAQPSTT